MKVNTIVKTAATKRPKLVEAEAAVESALATQPAQVESVIFPASDRFKNMLSLIARDNKELYNRIVGLE